MRFWSLLTALAVMLVLYGLVFERERILAFSGAEPLAADTEALPETAPVAPEAARRVSVLVLRSQARAIERAVILRGRTEAARKLSVMAETTGRVVSPPLRRGAYIQAGQVLCAIDPGTRRASLAEAEARLAEAEARLGEAEVANSNAQSLSQGGFASETRLAETEAALKAALASVEAARAELAAAEAEIARLTIAAPFEGILETDTAEIGTLLQPGALCAEIVDLDPILLVGFVPETEVERVTVGAVAAARLASGQELAGRVTFLARSADAATRTFHVEVEVANAELAIRDGQTVEIAVSGEGESAHLIPASALTLNDAGDLGVRLAEGGAARFAPVTLLRDTVEGVWVAGLPAETEVIVLGQEYVTDGTALDVTYSERAP
jgi:multidrug efflux system membrane fusion protein